MTTRLALVFALLAAPALAAGSQTDEREEVCGYEAQVMTAVQQARLDNVAQDKVVAHIAAGTPAWPENYSAAIPGMVDYIYQLRRRDLKNNDFGAIWKQQCLDMWEQRQQMIKQLKN